MNVMLLSFLQPQSQVLMRLPLAEWDAGKAYFVGNGSLYWQGTFNRLQREHFGRFSSHLDFRVRQVSQACVALAIRPGRGADGSSEGLVADTLKVAAGPLLPPWGDSIVLFSGSLGAFTKRHDGKLQVAGEKSVARQQMNPRAPLK